jgi:predicted RNase H-like HicB family nuclease
LGFLTKTKITRVCGRRDHKDANTTAMGTIRRYICEAMKGAEYERMEDGEFFASIAEFEGRWASGPTVEEARNDLEVALESWIVAALTVSHSSLPRLVTLILERTES